MRTTRSICWLALVLAGWLAPREALADWHIAPKLIELLDAAAFIGESEDRPIELVVAPEAYDVIKVGFRPELGTRELERTIERLVVQPLARALLAGTFRDRGRVIVGRDGDGLALRGG